MKRKFNTAAVILILLAAPITASARHSDGNPEECFPACKSVKAEIEEAPDQTGTPQSSPAPSQSPRVCSSTAGRVNDVENINSQIRPVKEWVGYVRSPQGLAVKLVNDHLFKIPGWVGFALDPVGAIKHKAVDQVRQRTKDLLMHDNAECIKLDALSIDAA